MNGEVDKKILKSCQNFTQGEGYIALVETYITMLHVKYPSFGPLKFQKRS
jgi:hypothetical protein